MSSNSTTTEGSSDAAGPASANNSSSSATTISLVTNNASSSLPSPTPADMAARPAPGILKLPSNMGYQFQPVITTMINPQMQ